MASHTAPARILVSRKGHGPTRDRLLSEFDTIIADPDEVPQLSPQDRASITGFACLFVSARAELIDALPNLQIIASFGVGYDNVDAAHAAQKGIMVTHTPHVLDDEVADTAIGLLINTVRELPRAETWLRQGDWVARGPYRLTPLTLRNRTVGIFGLGRIGLAVARRLEGFDLDIHYHNRSRRDDVAYTYHGSLADLAEACDTLISVAPGTPQTHHAIDADILGRLGPDGVLINVGRGSVVDEAALIAALSDRTIAAAGLDVFEVEPNVPRALIDAPNACLLPHVASASVHTRTVMGDLVVDNLSAWFGTGKALTPVPETRHLQP
ncbi:MULTISPECIES: 2-hydroxyacid dehydrogenase [unclassified Roseitalea]|uniref:2-hydroxyacid dehydrogenase n=1 Tax=unclassified Roseitalea TaxID=2639107 RepID=UPI00273E3AFD|nr:MULTISPECIES: 2-hydroxyacid dehydrogenase [unclassified Roseitalea]